MQNKYRKKDSEKIDLISQNGITVAVLVITIVVMLILVGVTVSVSIKGGIFGSTNEATFKKQMVSILEEFNLFIRNKTMEDNTFEQGSLSASKELLTYNTKVGLEGNIYTVLADAPDEYIDKFEIIKGELIYTTQNLKELEWAKELGIKVNPYLIIDGELVSADMNLFLLDDESGTITIPSTATSIGEGAFGNVTGVKKIIIPSTVKEIKKNAFYNCKGLEEVVFETREQNGELIGIEKIGEYAFLGCTNLLSIELPDTLTTLGLQTFSGCTKLNHIILSSGLKIIPAQLFYNCGSLKNIIIPEGVETMNYEVFHLCKNLESITLPKSLNSIGNGAFKYCESLENIDIAEGNTNFVFSDDGILFNGDKTQILFILMSAINETQTTFIVPDGVTILTQGILDNFTQINKVIIPDSVTDIKSFLFFTSSITEVEIDENNPNYATSGGAVCNKDKTILYFYYQDAKNVTSINLDENIESIHTSVFSRCGKLQTVNLGKNVSNIHGLAFENADRLVTVNIDEQNPNFVSEGGAIYTKDKKQIITAIGRGITTFAIPEGVEKIGDSAFYGKYKLTEIIIPNTVTSIGASAFNACNALEKIEIPNSVQTIGNNAFGRSAALKQIIIDKEKGSISGSPWGCTIRR